jgi:hypothetical protein
MQKFCNFSLKIAKSGYFDFIDDILVNGYSILDDMDHIRKQIGLCQQHDVFNEDQNPQPPIKSIYI